MANIFNYKSNEAYKNAVDRPAQQSSISYDGSVPQYDGVNVIVPFYESNAQIGDMVLYDTVEKCHKLLKWRTYNAESFDDSRYIIGRGVYQGAWDGILYFTSIDSLGSYMWSEACYFRVTDFDLSQAGSFTFNSYHAWKSHNGITISWTAGAAYSDIVASLKAAAIEKSYFLPAVLADNTGIGIKINYPTTDNVSSIFTITAKTGGAENVSFQYMNQYNGKDVVWQYVLTSSLVEGRLKNANILRRTGLMTSWAGLTPRFNEYYRINGSKTFQKESSTSPMAEEMWNSLATSTDAEQKALYDKYNGDYTAYMDNQKVVLETARGIMGTSDSDAAEQTNLIAEIMTQDYDFNIIPAFPCHHKVRNYGVNSGVTTGFEAGNWGMYPLVQLADLMLKVGYNSNDKTELNLAIDKFNSSGNIYYSQYFWSNAEYSAFYSYVFYGYDGTLDFYNKTITLGVRGVLALPALKY